MGSLCHILYGRASEWRHIMSQWLYFAAEWLLIVDQAGMAPHQPRLTLDCLRWLQIASIWLGTSRMDVGWARMNSNQDILASGCSRISSFQARIRSYRSRMAPDCIEIVSDRHREAAGCSKLAGDSTKMDLIAITMTLNQNSLALDRSRIGSDCYISASVCCIIASGHEEGLHIASEYHHITPEWLQTTPGGLYRSSMVPGWVRIATDHPNIALCCARMVSVHPDRLKGTPKWRQISIEWSENAFK